MVQRVIGTTGSWFFAAFLLMWHLGDKHHLELVVKFTYSLIQKLV